MLTGDINLKNIGGGGTNLGNNEAPFTGTFDGNGHIISNVNIVVEESGDSSFTGLFGVLENAVVRNLAVENCFLESRTSGGLYAGVIAGKMQNSLVEDCYVSGKIVINGETAYCAGGIAGAVFQNGEGENVEIVNNISRCVSNVVVDVEHEQGESGSLAVLNIPERVEYLGSAMISGTKVASVKIPKNITSVGTGSTGYRRGPLAGANALKEVVFEEGLEKIPSYMCPTGNSDTSCITKVVKPESVTAIGSYAFNRCDNMTIYGYKNSYAETYTITESIPFVSVAIAKNALVEDIINHLDINHLINNISLAGNEIQGPTVTIAGKTFSLFTIPASMDMALGDKVQAKVDKDKKIIQVMIGFDKFDGSAQLDPSDNKTAYWSESYKQVKSLYTGITGKQVTSVTFSGGEGSSGRRPAALTGTARTVVTLPENTYTKAGYVFVGWSDGENALEAGTTPLRQFLKRTGQPGTRKRNKRLK